MAKQFYNVEEAREKLGMSEDDLKGLVRDGQLREFRDGGQIKYRVEDVDGLAENLATLSGSLSGTSGELVLEPADETSMGLTGSDMLTLDEADRSDADDTTVDDADKKDDTVITSVGISVFDDEEVAEADPRARTVVDEKDKTSGGSSMALDSMGSSGTGSGLLDLTRESDDTSLGAELLDEIYTEDQEAGLPEIGEDTRAGLDAAIPEERETEPAAFEQEAAPAPRAAASPMVVQSSSEPVDAGLSGTLFAAILCMVVAGMAVSANLQGVFPTLLEWIFKHLLIFGAAAAGVAAICFVVGMIMGKRSAR